MMRTIFWILLAANVIFFAAMQWGGLLTEEPAAAMQPELHAGKIRLLGASPSPVAASQPASVEVAPAASAPGPDVLSCMEWGEFSGGELTRASGALNALHLGERMTRREVEYSIGYWVFIPPLKDKAAVAKKIEQLKVRGVTEYFVIQEAGAWLNAISLGVFRTREAAQNFVSQLRSQDVRSAQIGERSSKLLATIFVFDGLDVAMKEKLAAMEKDFSGSELKQVSCTH